MPPCTVLALIRQVTAPLEGNGPSVPCQRPSAALIVTEPESPSSRDHSSSTDDNSSREVTDAFACVEVGELAHPAGYSGPGSVSSTSVTRTVGTGTVLGGAVLGGAVLGGAVLGRTGSVVGGFVVLGRPAVVGGGLFGLDSVVVGGAVATVVAGG
jgi:hypothetical protein